MKSKQRAKKKKQGEGDVYTSQPWASLIYSRRLVSKYHQSFSKFKRGGGVTAGQHHRKMNLWWRPSILSSNPTSYQDRARGKVNVKMGVNIVVKVGVDAS